MARKRKNTDTPITLFSFQDIMCCLVGVLVLIALTLAIEGLAAETLIERARVDPAAAAAATMEAQEQSTELEHQIQELQRELQARQSGSEVTQQEVEVLEARVRQEASDHERLRQRLAALEERVAQANAAARARADEVARAQQQIIEAELALRRQRIRLRPGALALRTPFFVEVSAADLRVGDLDPSQAPVMAQTLPGFATDAQVVDAIGVRQPGSHYAVLVVHADGIARFGQLRDVLFGRGYEVGWQLWDGSAGWFLEKAPTAASAQGAMGAP